MDSKHFLLGACIIARHDHNGTYRRQEVCVEKHVALDVKCNLLQTGILENKHEISSIKRKIDATLLGVIGILISVVFILVKVWIP